jgi:hypothetical protein
MWHRKVAAETVNSIHHFTGGNRKCLAKYECHTRGLYSHVPAACHRPIPAETTRPFSNAV